MDDRTDERSYEYHSFARFAQFYDELHWGPAWRLSERSYPIGAPAQNRNWRVSLTTKERFSSFAKPNADVGVGRRPRSWRRQSRRSSCLS